MYDHANPRTNNDIMIHNEESSEHEYSNEYQSYGTYFQRY